MRRALCGPPLPLWLLQGRGLSHLQRRKQEPLPPPHHQAQESVPATSGTSGACRAESTPRADELEDESAGFTANLLWKPSHLEQRLHIGVHLENRGKVSSGYRT